MARLHVNEASSTGTGTSPFESGELEMVPASDPVPNVKEELLAMDAEVFPDAPAERSMVIK